jgi:hypothetical protein
MTCCGLGKIEILVTEMKGDECSSSGKNRKASSQNFFRVRHQEKPGCLKQKGANKKPILTVEREKGKKFKTWPILLRRRERQGKDTGLSIEKTHTQL